MTCPRCGSPVRADITTLRDFNGARLNWRCTQGHSFWEGVEAAGPVVPPKGERRCERCGERLEKKRPGHAALCLPCGPLRDMELRRERDARKRLVTL